MMTVPCSSGRCAMRADRRTFCRPLLGMALALILSGVSLMAVAAEAPLTDAGSSNSVLPLPPEAEAAHQDLLGPQGGSRTASGKSLDEAIFTEISPLTIPEIGLALPADQEH